MYSINRTTLRPSALVSCLLHSRARGWGVGGGRGRGFIAPIVACGKSRWCLRERLVPRLEQASRARHGTARPSNKRREFARARGSCSSPSRSRRRALCPPPRRKRHAPSLGPQLCVPRHRIRGSGLGRSDGVDGVNGGGGGWAGIRIIICRQVKSVAFGRPDGLARAVVACLWCSWCGHCQCPPRSR